MYTFDDELSPRPFWLEVMQMLQPPTGEKAHQNVEVEVTEPRTMVTRVYREIRVEGKSAKTFVILATSKKKKK